MKILKMTQSKHVADRWYVDMEDGSKLQVNLSLIAEYSLFTGRELTDEEMKNLRNDAEKTEFKARALRILGTRSMSGKELFDKLKQKGADEHAAAETVAWAEKYGYINDVEYAAMIVRHYSAKGYGTRRVTDELYKRGIDRNMWDDALAHMPMQGGTLDEIIAKKLHGKEPDKKEMKRLTDMLLRRGFSWEEVRSALRRYEVEAEDE